ncbi:jg21754 [Pararge aegeria aegeria]|uniref:Jg21754 protein n=1 Tax=Pararge aegeria aegeria TaxID=348720 RepID=A0A8S4S3J1_9NEOP|nr:jg21754 [Pararge aegeria aegeria]
MSGSEVIEVSSENPVKPEDLKTIQLLAKGVMEIYEPPLATLNTHLKELTEKQEAVHNMLSSERRRLEDLQNDAMLDALLIGPTAGQGSFNSHGCLNEDWSSLLGHTAYNSLQVMRKSKPNNC